MYKNHVISTKNELLTSGYRIPSRPDHNGADYVDAAQRQKTSDVGILAFADGIVVSVRFGDSVGWNVDILHAGGFLTRYAHMKNGSISVKKGEKAKQGQTIGIMGKTGNSTGIHLHFEIKENVKENEFAYKNDTYYLLGTHADPEPYLKGNKTMGTLTNLSSEHDADEKIMILPSAETYAGTTTPIPEKYKNVAYTVKQTRSDRVLIKELGSWILNKDVVKI